MLLDCGYVRPRGRGATTCSLTASTAAHRPPQLESPLERFIGHNLNGDWVLCCNSRHPAGDLYGLVAASWLVPFGGDGKFTVTLVGLRLLRQSPKFPGRYTRNTRRTLTHWRHLTTRSAMAMYGQYS